MTEDVDQASFPEPTRARSPLGWNVSSCASPLSYLTEAGRLIIAPNFDAPLSKALLNSFEA